MVVGNEELVFASDRISFWEGDKSWRWRWGGMHISVNAQCT